METTTTTPKPKEQRAYRDRREYFRAYHNKKYLEDEQFRNNAKIRAQKSYLKKKNTIVTCACGTCLKEVP